jgi:formate dehydrogenase iron-sulfur subunit
MPITAFLTDSTLCIGCKACEVACKEWNGVPADGFAFTGYSYDNTVSLGHSTWRHVKFIERGEVPTDAASACGAGASDSLEPPRARSASGSAWGWGPKRTDAGEVPRALINAGYRSNSFRWDFSSDVCKHCENAGCLEACPTGSIVRTEFGGVYIQPDVCNGCGYCIVSCPFGVVDRRPDDGRAFKCTFCYDRQKAGLQPACATVCPTQSIQFGEIGDLRERAARRVEDLRARGIDDARVYDPRDSSVGGSHAIFIFRGEPEEYNLPSSPEVPTVHLRSGWQSAAAAAGLMLVGIATAFFTRRSGAD